MNWEQFGIEIGEDDEQCIRCIANTLAREARMATPARPLPYAAKANVEGARDMLSRADCNFSRVMSATNETERMRYLAEIGRDILRARGELDQALSYREQPNLFNGG